MTAAAETLKHYLRTAGAGRPLASGALIACDESVTPQSALAAAREGAVVVASQPSTALLAALGVTVSRIASGPWRGVYRSGRTAGFGRLRGFGPTVALHGEDLEPVVLTDEGEPMWSWRAEGRGGVLLIGNDLAADIVRFKQGDPSREPYGGEQEKWGYGGERPNYLFEADLDPDRPHDRPADWPLFALADFVRIKTGSGFDPALPDEAACAIVVTGDTDVAQPEHYEAQRRLLGDLPITYFLRTACAPSGEVLRRLDADPRVDLQLHPDALDAPGHYPERLAEQIGVFERAVGRRPTSLRNHGFLNDRYWRHAGSWIDERMTWSANLPGVDGCVLNGSLLPARLLLDGRLTPHWSLVTPYGDGMMFALNLSGEAAAARIEAHVEEIVRSGAPGVLTLNLHPVNVARTGALHDVLHRLAEKGVAMWSLAECARWFERRDAVSSPL